MSSNHEQRRFWWANWLGSIQDFADVNTQRRMWLDIPNTNTHFSFVEYICCYFDDLGLSDGGYQAALTENLVSVDEVAAVADFHRIACDYKNPTDDHDHEAILADPNWAEVVAAARRAQSALYGLIDDAHERSLLMGREAGLEGRTT
jgi:hypothetical protein